MEEPFKKKTMSYIFKFPLPKFSSNIYLFRSNLSDWLSIYVTIRKDFDFSYYNEIDRKELDVLLKKVHYRFIEVKKAIEILEKETYVFGGIKSDISKVQTVEDVGLYN